ncbi:hypothetical protein PIB30_034466 [Stylosanthes scabra]|uniref:ADP-ribosyl cyclase/cyclic ADP-ribose hydrolase n=1 Tax=Stylosanthes scabra TaxID=79078 RepID=A0ABU6UC96_9FABA|nr:hypothetical protein [Stylosanthes scabra]
MANNKEVFLSFRGGTRFQFTDHLYHALLRSGINTFRDDERVKSGDKLEPLLMKAIQNCKMAIVVLCEDYASSTWCLKELVKIIECHEKHGKQVLAIIYRVKPSDVWEQKGSYEKALAILEKREDPEKVKAWRLALSKIQKWFKVEDFSKAGDELMLTRWVLCTEDICYSIVDVL